MDVPQLLRRHGRAVEELLEKEVPRTAVDYLSEGVWYQFSSGGKRLRPALCLMTCEVLGGDPRHALPFALATEILHNTLLIHDDIEDGDTMRRDRDTLWVRQGIPNALNVADYLIARAYRLIADAPLEPQVIRRLVSAFSYAFERTVEGQALDINLRGSPEVTLETYLRIVRLKTSYYLALTWVGGAIIAGAPEAALGDLWELGRLLGPAFQIRDDLIDLTEGKGRGGEVGCDIREGKPSIFVAFVLEYEKGSPEERNRLIQILATPRGETTPEDVRWAIDFYRREGALEYAENRARGLAEEADRVLDRLPFSAEGREGFREMARFIIGRTF